MARLGRGQPQATQLFYAGLRPPPAGVWPVPLGTVTVVGTPTAQPSARLVLIQRLTNVVTPRMARSISSPALLGQETVLLVAPTVSIPGFSLTGLAKLGQATTPTAPTAALSLGPPAKLGTATTPTAPAVAGFIGPPAKLGTATTLAAPAVQPSVAPAILGQATAPVEPEVLLPQQTSPLRLGQATVPVAALQIASTKANPTKLGTATTVVAPMVTVAGSLIVPTVGTPITPGDFDLDGINPPRIAFSIAAPGGTLGIIRRRKVQMHAVVYDQNASNGGPGTKLFELTPDILNVVWQKSINLPGNAAFTLMNTSRRMQELEWMQSHIALFREDSRGVERVFRGKIVQPDHGPTDTVILCWDYLAFYQRYRVDYYLNGAPKRYANRAIGGENGIIADLWQRAKDITDGQLRFVGKGVFQNPRSDNGNDPVKTGKEFGIADLQDYLTVFYDLSEMAMANTDNTVVFEIDEANKFNLWRDRRKTHTGIALTFPGTLVEHSFTRGFGSIFNDFATLMTNASKPTGKQQVTIEQQTGSAGINTIRRLQGSGKIGTIAGFSNETTRKGARRQAAERIARANRRLPRSLVAYPRQGYISEYPSVLELGHKLLTHLKVADGQQLKQELQLQSIAAGWSWDGGERMQLYLREPEA